MTSHILLTAVVLTALAALAVPAWRHDRRRTAQQRRPQRTTARRHPSDDLDSAGVDRLLAAMCRDQTAADRIRREH